MCIEDRPATDISDYDDIFDKVSPNMFSDPESEWNGNFRIDNLEDDDDDDNLRPESEQSSVMSQLTKPIHIPRFTY